MTQSATIPAPKTRIPRLPGVPVLGNLPAFGRDPVGTLERGWRQLGDLFVMQIGPRQLHVVSNPNTAHAVLVDGWRTFTRPREVLGGTLLTPLLGHSVLTTDGESWLSKRRLMQPVFHRQRIQHMGDQMAEAGVAMLKRWEAQPAGAPVNFSAEMKLVTLDIINRTMFSTNVLPEADQLGPVVDEGLHFVSKMTRSLINLPPGWPTPARIRFKKLRATLDAYLYGVISERRASSRKRGDLLDMLLDARDEDTGLGMSDEQVRNEVATIYGAGHETTAIALTWAWLALNQNPGALRALRAEVDGVLAGRTPTMADLPALPYTLQVLEESMRLFPPVPITARMAYEPAMLGGHALPARSLVLVAINNIHRHPGYWEDAETFRPERFAPGNKASLNKEAYLPFLTGPHLCIGNSFALMEGQLLLALMAQRYDVRVVPDRQIERELAITMRPKGGLRVTLHPR